MQFRYNVFDFADNPAGVAFKIYCVDETRFLSVVKGLWVKLKFWTSHC